MNTHIENLETENALLQKKNDLLLLQRKNRWLKIELWFLKKGLPKPDVVAMLLGGAASAFLIVNFLFN